MATHPASPPRPVCPKCHLPIRDGQHAVSYEGAFYHRDCAPAPGSKSEKDNPYSDSNPIAI